MKILPFYTSTGQRDAERVSSQDALLCPRFKLLPWQIQRDHLADTYLTSLDIVDCDGNETDIFDNVFGNEHLVKSWTNAAAPNAYNTLDTSGSTILTAIESSASTGFAYSNEFPLATGESIQLEYTQVHTSGQVPKFYLGKSDGTFYSTGISIATGNNIDYLVANGNDGGDVRLLVYNTNDTSYSCAMDEVQKNNLQVNEFTSYDFITYNGVPLRLELPYGVYYVKTSDDNTTWYSEWFSVQDLHTQVITEWASETYTTFNNPVGLVIAQAIQASGTAYVRSNTFTVRTGERLTFVGNFVSISNQFPSVTLRTGTGVVSESIQLKQGMNEIVLTSTQSGTAWLQLTTTATTSWQLNTIIGLYRTAGIHLEYTNTNDIQGARAILYQFGFSQEIYLDTVMGSPQHEIIETGEEPNGVFQAEKLVDKLLYNIVAYGSRSTVEALRLLPMHDDIEIIDEVGNVYNPSVGNLRITWEETTFDTYTIRINFNEEGDVWTSNMDNIT